MVEAVVGGEEANRECPNCYSTKNWKDGLRETTLGSCQRFLCRKCGFRFSEKSYKEYLTTEDRQLCAIKKAKKLDTATEIKTVAGEGKGILVEYGWKLKKRQLQENTISLRTYLLNQLIEKGADLNNTDSVETVLATEPFTACKKHQLVAAYRSYTTVFKIPWEPVKAKYTPKKPFVPLEAELDQLIAASGKRTAAFLQTLKDTGARCGELCKLKTNDIDEAKLTITISSPEKGSNSRTVKVNEKTIAMLRALSKKYAPYVFNPDSSSVKNAIATVRKKLAQTLQNDRFKQIHLHSFRHWKATTEYAKTLNLPHVMELLGHKNVNNTMIYMHLAKFESRECETAYAKTLQEEDELLKAGFDFIRFNEKEQVAVYRRRK
jgi:integrase